MPRIARVVVPTYPHHVVQRGNRRQQTFFGHEDYLFYQSLMREETRRFGVSIWEYTLMPNHVHHEAAPEHAAALARAIGEIHRRYTRSINDREGWRGYLWQGRFWSAVLDEPYSIRTARYILLNPVRAGLVAHASEWPYGSARRRLGLADDPCVSPNPLDHVEIDWHALLSEPAPEAEYDLIRKHVRTGRPLGSDPFVRGLERALKRPLVARPAGRPHGRK
jgi:putative transposase